MLCKKEELLVKVQKITKCKKMHYIRNMLFSFLKKKKNLNVEKNTQNPESVFIINYSNNLYCLFFFKSVKKLLNRFHSLSHFSFHGKIEKPLGYT